MRAKKWLRKGIMDEVVFIASYVPAHLGVQYIIEIRCADRVVVLIES